MRGTRREGARARACAGAGVPAQRAARSPPPRTQAARAGGAGQGAAGGGARVALGSGRVPLARQLSAVLGPRPQSSQTDPRSFPTVK